MFAGDRDDVIETQHCDTHCNIEITAGITPRAIFFSPVPRYAITHNYELDNFLSSNVVHAETASFPCQYSVIVPPVT